jgi:hypothetical protein
MVLWLQSYNTISLFLKMIEPEFIREEPEANT